MHINFAYIDPSVMTYSIQAIAGVAVAVGGVAAIFWRRAKKMAKEKLGIENNTKKEVEEQIQLVEENGEEAQDNA